MTETISREEIARIQREFVLRNTLLDPVKVALLLDCSVKKVYRLVESGELVEASSSPGRSGMRISAYSVEEYRVKIVTRAASARGTA